MINAHHIFYVCNIYTLCAIFTRKKYAYKDVFIKTIIYVFFGGHAGMKVASIAEKYMYIINQRQIKMVELYLFVNVSQNSYCPLLI